MANLITQAELLSSLNNLADRTDLPLLISAASSSIRRETGHDFGSGTATETLDGLGTSRLYLRHVPVTAITSITVNGQALDNSAGDAWTLEPANGVVTRGNTLYDPQIAFRWPRGSQNIIVAYTYSEAVPDDVKMACMALVQHLSVSTKQTGSYYSEKIGDYSYTSNNTSASWPTGVSLLLNSYIRMTVE